MAVGIADRLHMMARHVGKHRRVRCSFSFTLAGLNAHPSVHAEVTVGGLTALLCRVAAPLTADFSRSWPVSRILCLCDDLSTRPTRRVGEQRHPLPIWPCFQRGLPGRPVTRTAGELLPHHFTLIPTNRDGHVSVALSVRLPCPGLRRALRSMKSGLSSPKESRPSPGQLRRDYGPSALFSPGDKAEVDCARCNITRSKFRGRSCHPTCEKPSHRPRPPS